MNSVKVLKKKIQKTLTWEMITPRQTELLKKLKTLKHKNEVSNDCSKKKVIGYLYRHSINFLPNDKINPDFPKSNKFYKILFTFIQIIAYYPSFSRYRKYYWICARILQLSSERELFQYSCYCSQPV